MKWCGVPIIGVTALVDGRRMEVGRIYRWSDGNWRTVWHIPKRKIDVFTIEHAPLGDDAKDWDVLCMRVERPADDERQASPEPQAGDPRIPRE